MEKIKDMLVKLLHLDTLVENLSGYVEAQVQLLKIEIREDVSKVLARGLIHGVILLFGFLFFLFFSLGMAQYINSLFSDTYSGYWIVSGFYLLVFLVFWAARKQAGGAFEKYFSNMIKHKENNERI